MNSFSISMVPLGWLRGRQYGRRERPRGAEQRPDDKAIEEQGAVLGRQEGKTEHGAYRVGQEQLGVHRHLLSGIRYKNGVLFKHFFK